MRQRNLRLTLEKIIKDNYLVEMLIVRDYSNHMSFFGIRNIVIASFNSLPFL